MCVISELNPNLVFHRCHWHVVFYPSAEKWGTAISVNDFVVKAVAMALHQVPVANGEC